MKKLLNFILLLIYPYISEGQAQPNYLVWQSTGNTWVISQGGAKARVKYKQHVNNNDIISIDKDSELELVNDHGDYFVLDKKGVYSNDDIKRLYKKSMPGLFKKYFYFIWDESIRHSSDFKNLDPRAITDSWGAGSRGDCDFAINPINGAQLTLHSILFRWQSFPETKRYNFMVFDNKHQNILSMVVKDTQIIISRKSLFTENNLHYYWSVNSAESACRTPSEMNFNLITPPEEKIEIDSLIKLVPFIENKKIYYLNISDMLGQNGFYDKAKYYFRKSCELFIKE